MNRADPNLKELSFEYLVDRPDDVPRVISWWHSVWADRMGQDKDRLVSDFRTTLTRHRLPLNIVAIHNGDIIGTAALKENEMLDVFPENRFWMGSIFVDPKHRGRGVATSLAGQIISLARQRQLPHLYLQTADVTGGLYARLGWKPVERLLYRGIDTLLMIRRLPG